MMELELNKNFSEISENDLYCVDGGAGILHDLLEAIFGSNSSSGQGGSHVSSSGRVHGGGGRRF